MHIKFIGYNMQSFISKVKQSDTLHNIIKSWEIEPLEYIDVPKQINTYFKRLQTIKADETDLTKIKAEEFKQIRDKVLDKDNISVKEIDELLDALDKNKVINKKDKEDIAKILKMTKDALPEPPKENETPEEVNDDDEEAKKQEKIKANETAYRNAINSASKKIDDVEKTWQVAKSASKGLKQAISMIQNSKKELDEELNKIDTTGFTEEISKELDTKYDNFVKKQASSLKKYNLWLTSKKGEEPEEEQKPAEPKKKTTKTAKATKAEEVQKKVQDSVKPKADTAKKTKEKEAAPKADWDKVYELEANIGDQSETYTKKITEWMNKLEDISKKTDDDEMKSYIKTLLRQGKTRIKELEG